MNQADLSQQKIMVVDDNFHYVRLIERILQINSYQNILSLTDPKKVVELYRTSQPDLLLMDAEMLCINVFDILNLLQNEECGGFIPVILFTEHTDQKERALRLGAQDVISKPFSQAEVLTSIESFFKRKMERESAARREKDALDSHTV